MPATPQSRRARPAKPPLSREAVVAAGLELLHREGLGAVTMRRVATALDTGPASLYVYVAGADELHAELLDAVLGLVPLPELDSPRWREQLVQLLLDMIATLNAHAGVARVAIARIPLGPRAIHLAETMLALLDAGGIEPQAAAWAVDLLSLYATAVSFETGVYLAEGLTEEQLEPEYAGIREFFESLSAEQFPRMRAMAALLTHGSGDQRERFGIEVLVNGLLATPSSRAGQTG